MKKIIAGVMAIALVFGSAAVLPVSDFNDNSVISACAYAGEDDYYYSGDWEYILNEDDTACITSYVGEYSSDVVLYIPSELDGHIVTSLGNFHFETDVSEIHIPSSIKYIAPTSFYNPFKNAEYCEAEYVVDPDNDVYASKDGFLYSKDMKTIFAGPIIDTLSISSEIETISPYIYPLVQTAFDVDLNNNVYTSENGLLYRKDMKTLLACPKAKSGELFIPEGVETIGENNLNISSYDEFFIDTYGAFSYCDNIDVVFPSTLKRIENYAFHFTNLSNCNIEIPNGVTYIGDYAFCIKPLVSSMFNDTVYMTIPDSIEYLGDCVFGPINNDKLYIYCYVSSVAHKYASENGFAYEFLDEPIADEASASTSDSSAPNPEPSVDSTNSQPNDQSEFKRTEVTDGIEITDNTVTGDTVKIPETIDNKNVVSIGNWAFAGMEIKSVELPSVLKSIGEYAFFNCPALTSVTIPKSVENIGDYALGYYLDENAVSGTSTVTLAGAMTVDMNKVKKVDGFKIYCYTGTAGEKYAVDNGFDYVLLDKSDTDTSSKSETASNPNKTNTSSTSNPSTGAAAGLALAAVGLGAVVVTKRRK